MKHTIVLHIICAQMYNKIIKLYSNCLHNLFSTDGSVKLLTVKFGTSVFSKKCQKIFFYLNKLLTVNDFVWATCVSIYDL